MVSVEVNFPVIKKTYEFSLDEDVLISILIGEMTELIAQTKQTLLVDDTEQFTLCDLDRELILAQNGTLGAYNIKNGARLMLV